MTDAFQVRELEVGFFTAEPAQRVGGLPAVHAPGLPVSDVQYWRIEAVPSGSQAAGQHLVVMAHYPALSRQVCELIRRVVEPSQIGVALSFVHEASGLQVEATSFANPVEAAAAIAEVMRAGTLDDVECVGVMIGDDHFSVDVRWSGGATIARVSRGRRTRG